jgi:sugar lactone lactonase YvrE
MSDYRILRLNLSDLYAGTASEAFDGIALTNAKVEAKTEEGPHGLAGGGIVYNGITSICTDYSGNIYGVSSAKNMVVKIEEGGRISWVAGDQGGNAGNNAALNNVAANLAKFNAPSGIACDKYGTLYIADTSNNQIRTVKDGKVNVLAGSAYISGLTDGTGVDARFYQPISVAVDKGGTVWVADRSNHALRKITNDGYVLTVAGNGTAGYTCNVQANNHTALLKLPNAVTVDAQGNVYVSSASAAGLTDNNIIKKYTPDGWLYRFSGGGNVGRSLGLGGSDGTVNTCSQFTCSYTAIFDLACETSGNVYVIDHMSTGGRLLKLSRDGAPSEVADWNGNSYHGPYSIAVSPAQTLFVANTIL